MFAILDCHRILQSLFVPAMSIRARSSPRALMRARRARGRGQTFAFSGCQLNAEQQEQRRHRHPAQQDVARRPAPS